MTHTLFFWTGPLLLFACNDSSFSSKQASQPVPAENLPVEIGEKPEEEPGPPIPGTPVTMVGIGFEDGSDNDFNDISVCFEGQFNVDGVSIVSTSQQLVNVRVRRITGNRHTTVTEVRDEGGQVLDSKRFQLANRETKTVELTYPLASKVFVHTTTSGGYYLDLNSGGRVSVTLNDCPDRGK